MAAEDPKLSEREQVIVRSLQRAASTERAPAQMRERIEAQRAGASSRPGSRALGSLGSLGSRIWSGAAAVAVAAVIAVVLLLTGGATTPSVASAAALATRGATMSAPAVDPSARGQLTASVGNLHFPNWGTHDMGWNAVGSRTDRLGNRDVKTVFYEKDGERIAYSIVSRPIINSGRPLTITSHSRTVFVWNEHGHTCLLSGAGVSASVLHELVGGPDSGG